jgi:hypothetical protein
VDAYSRSRLVSIQQIADEMGWPRQKAANRLMNHAWLFRGWRKPRDRYDARVIDALRELYGQAPEQSRDFLADYLKEIK